MPDLAKTLKEEIRRLAKKEVRAETTVAKQAISQYRHDIAELKRKVKEQEKQIAFLENREKERIEQPEAPADAVDNARFSPKSVKSQRRRLGLSAADYAKLVGVSPLTIYNWEHGKSRPRQQQMASLVAVRGIGKKEALRRLELLEEG